MLFKEIDMEEKCVLCGKPAKYISKRYVSPLCKKCAEREAKRIGEEKGLKFVELEDFYTEPCAEMENIQKFFTNGEAKG